jgi:hypothetical protein
VEWFDVAHLQEIRDKRLPPNIQTIDHAPRIAELLKRVGLEFEVGTTMIRVFGYTPKSLELFRYVKDRPKASSIRPFRSPRP